MRLFELFDKKADWKWLKMNDVEADAEITIGDQVYEVTIQEDAAENYIAGMNRHNQPIPKWLRMMDEDAEQQLYYVLFYHKSNERGMDYNLTGLGNQYTLFATVIDIMDEYSKNINVDWWTFTAKEPSRRALYDRMTKRFAGEVFTIDDLDGDKIYVVKA